MDREISRLVAAARGIGALIAPTRDDEGMIVISARDGKLVAHAVLRTHFSSIDGNQVLSHLGVSADGSADQRLTGRDAGFLAASMDRVALAAERKRKLARGQIPGALSGKEAMEFTRRFGR